MKNIIKFFALAVVILGFSANSFGQVSETATATGTIINPITITNAGDMNFGNIAVSASGGTVVLAPAGTRTITGGVTLPAFAAGTVTAAQFDVTGAINYTYSITLPAESTTVTNTTGTGAETMLVSAWSSDPTPTGTLDGSGLETIKVGATLTVGASQVAGVYVSGTPFTVTVNYN